MNGGLTKGWQCKFKMVFKILVCSFLVLFVTSRVYGGSLPVPAVEEEEGGTSSGGITGKVEKAEISPASKDGKVEKADKTAELSPAPKDDPKEEKLNKMEKKWQKYLRDKNAPYKNCSEPNAFHPSFEINCLGESKIVRNCHLKKGSFAKITIGFTATKDMASTNKIVPHFCGYMTFLNWCMADPFAKSENFCQTQLDCPLVEGKNYVVTVTKFLTKLIPAESLIAQVSLRDSEVSPYNTFGCGKIPLNFGPLDS